MYRLLEPYELVQPGDECYGLQLKWSEVANPEFIGKPALLCIGPVRRRIVTEWQTGPIPDPTEPCVLVVEAKESGNNAHYATSKVFGIFHWRIGDSLIDPNQCKDLPVATGRWCIQQIILPATDGIGENKQ